MYYLKGVLKQGV